MKKILTLIVLTLAISSTAVMSRSVVKGTPTNPIIDIKGGGNGPYNPNQGGGN